MKRHAALFLLLSVAACARPDGAQVAAIEPSGDPLQDAAALLVAAEMARDPQARAPMIARLNALNVGLLDGAGDDPLSGWRAQYQAAAGTQPFRGRALGPAYRRTRLAAGETVRIEQIFYAGERAAIAAQTSTSGTVALEISNPRSEAICAQDLTPRANCSWLPIFTERFAIELENKGTAPASIYLVFR